ELLARVRALLRRSTRTREPFLTCGDLSVDLSERRVSRGEKDIPLSRMEFAVLEHLMLHVRVPQSKDQIAAAIWKDETDPSPNAIEVFISALRRKLQPPGTPPLIHTRRGEGYYVGEQSDAGDDA
ncbi:MAG: response regulator transcription factor, partial [Planctomycetes bacterium]|nr:response regulator transcription factor [Planctomycetota bacterium]